MKSEMKIPELLAPAGGLTQLHAAVNNGADAVYLGGARFNARGKAENFALPGLRDAIRYAHERNVKIYVTFNTLLKDSELPDALDYAGALWDIGADAVIVQDMGLVRLLGRYLPDLPLHMSTQGTIAGWQAVDLMKDFGIRRIVPARELSLEEIRRMAAACHGPEPAEEQGCGAPAIGRTAARRAQNCELEVFVHGALCMCYSGQCQMSRLLGGGKAGRMSAGGMKAGKPGESGTGAKEWAGSRKAVAGGSVRSGNRGLCAQPCRLPYTDDQGRVGYFLSPKDLCLLEDIPALCEAGVDSLKIEGRLKSPEYVAVVTSIYRKYLDQFARTGEVRVTEEDRRDLAQIYNRGGFTKGYLYGNPGEKLLSGDSPKNTGICVGTVRSVVDVRSAGKDRAAAAGAAKKGAALVDAALQKQMADTAPQETLKEGDGVEMRPAESGGSAAAGSDRRAAGSAGLGGATGSAASGGVAGAAGSGGAAASGGVTASPAAGGVVTFCRALPGGILRIGDMKGQIRPGDKIFRVTHRALLERARATFDTEDPAELDRKMRYPRKLQMRFEAAVGRPAKLCIRESQDAVQGDTASDPLIRVYAQEVMEEARSRPADPERIRQQLGKLGGTPFVVSPEDISVSLDGRCAVPVAQINRMRREGIGLLLGKKGRVDRMPVDQAALAAACERLEKQRLEAPAFPDAALMPLMQFMEPGTGADEKRTHADCGTDADEKKTHGDCEIGSGVKKGSGAKKTRGDRRPVLPYIDAVSKGRLDAYIEAHFAQITARLRETDTGILIRGNNWIKEFLDAGVKVYGGHGLNIYNEEARMAYEEIGVAVAELSHETGISADGRIPLMITEHEVQSKTLTDRKGRVHRIERSYAGDKTLIW